MELKDILIALVIGLVIGGITVGSLLGQLKSVVQQHAAADYVNKGSMQLRQKQDLFLNTKTERTPIQRQTPPPANNSHPTSSHSSR